MHFNPPPHWPRPPTGWTPPPGWQPDPAWGPPPAGWPLWVQDAGDGYGIVAVNTWPEADPQLDQATLASAGVSPLVFLAYMTLTPGVLGWLGGATGQPMVYVAAATLGLIGIVWAQARGAASEAGFGYGHRMLAAENSGKAYLLVGLMIFVTTHSFAN